MQRIQQYLGDFRVWVVFFFLVRLIGITQPPLETGHNWRQSLTNMISRNLMEEGEMFYPKIDMAGNETGIIGAEFPVFNALIALNWKVAGFSHGNGRLINLVVSTLGIWYFFLLVSLIFNRRVAFLSGWILMVSIWFAFSRKIMPDTFSVSLMIIALFYAYQFLINKSNGALVAFVILSSLGVLCKLPSISLLVFLSVCLFDRNSSLHRKSALFSAAGLAMIFPIYWYFVHVPFLVETYHYPLFFPKGIREGIAEILPLWNPAMEKFYFHALQSFVAFGCFLAGIYFMWKENIMGTRITALLFVAVFFVFILKTGAVFPLHNYYIIPFVPFMALITGYFLSKIPQKAMVILLVVITVESIANQQHDFFISQKEKYKLTLENIMDAHIPNDALIVINGGQNPQSIYFANRKGWTVENEVIIDTLQMQVMHEKGARFLVIDKHRCTQEFPYPIVFKNEDYGIYSLYIQKL